MFPKSKKHKYCPMRIIVIKTQGGKLEGSEFVNAKKCAWQRDLFVDCDLDEGATYMILAEMDYFEGEEELEYSVTSYGPGNPWFSEGPEDVTKYDFLKAVAISCVEKGVG